MSDTLGIRARRSKKPRKVANNGLRNPLTDHTIDDDLPYIVEYAGKYAELDPKMREILDSYVFKNHSLDYYYGSYVSTYQDFVMAHQSNNDLAPALMTKIYTISSRIVEVINANKDLIKNAKSISDIASCIKK